MNTYNISMGPLLGVESDTLYTICVLLQAPFHNDNPVVKLNNQIYHAAQLTGDNPYMACGSQSTYRFYRFEIPMTNNGDKDLLVEYQLFIGQEVMINRHYQSSWTFAIPPMNAIPKIAHGSCAGVDGVRPATIDSKNYLGFQKMIEVAPHYLFLSGDQVYADCITDSDTGFKEYFLSNGALPKGLSDKIDEFYLQLYIESWTCNIHFATVLATIPNVMTWDDHDIIDGYGSHIPEIQLKYKVLFESAEKYYKLFQCRGKYNEVQYLILRNQLFVIPDTRSFREEKVILKEEQYTSMQLTLDGFNRNNTEFYNVNFILPVPIAHMDFTNWVENAWRQITNWLYKQKFVVIHDDDIVDHWDHKYHENEQLRILKIIFEYGKILKARYLTLVSGDVHCGGGALIEKKISDRETLYASQFVTSPLVNFSSSKTKLIIYAITKNSKTIGDYICNLKNFGTRGRKNMYKRNFLIIYPTSKQKDENIDKKSASYLCCEMYYELNDNWALQDDIRAYKNLKKFKDQ